MNSVFLVVRLNQDDTIAEVISAHPNKQTAASAERYWRSMQPKHNGLLTDVIEVDFEA
jgi:hypothetical protein